MSVFYPKGQSVVQVLGPSVRVAIPSGATIIRITQVNGQAGAVPVNLGDSSVTASSSNGMIIRPYSEHVFIGVGGGETHVAFSGTASVSVSITFGEMM